MLWLTCYRHRQNPRWKCQTNHWSILSIFRAWRYGYRRFRVSRHPFDLALVN